MIKKYADGLINDVEMAEIVAELNSLEKNPAYLTKAKYRGVSERWTYNYTSFVDYHLNILKTNPSLEPKHYIANLRLILRK